MPGCDRHHAGWRDVEFGQIQAMMLATQEVRSAGKGRTNGTAERYRSSTGSRAIGPEVKDVTYQQRHFASRYKRGDKVLLACSAIAPSG